MSRAPSARWIGLAVALSIALSFGIGARAQQAHGARFVDGRGAPLDPARDALAVSRRIPNDASLPRSIAGPGDPLDFRIELDAPAGERPIEEIAIRSVAPDGTIRHAQEHVALQRDGDVLRSRLLRLVASDLDAAAPGVTDRVLRVALGDRVRAVLGGAVVAEIGVGRPGDEDHPLAIRHATVRVRIVRNAPGGPPPIGGDDATAIALARDQIAIANEVWSQCAITLGAPEDADVAIVDPPPPATIAIADLDGLPAAGGGRVRLRVDGRAIPPITTRAGARPVETALALAASLARSRFAARVFENERAESGADRSADLIVRRRDGTLASVVLESATDARQSVTIGSVDLGDGLVEFDNMIALTGTLEERALIRALSDDDDATIDVLIVSEFTGRTRDGEAFVEGESAGSSASIANVVVLAREGVARARTAFTFPHELGHVLLDHPLHPDHLGPDRPWLLMDSNTSEGSILGPRRLTEGECARARARSGPDQLPALLRRTLTRTPRSGRPRASARRRARARVAPPASSA